MSVGVIVTIQDHATPAINAMVAQLTPRRLAAKIGPGLNRLVQNKLISNGENKNGWPTTHFWADAARATSWKGLEDGVLISINKIGVRQRVFGGTIKPVNAGALTIPISPVSYGHLASEFPGLFLLRTKTGSYLVQRGEEVSEKGNTVKRTKGGGNAKRRIRANLNFMFKLVASVTQAANPDVIPSNDTLASAALDLIKGGLNAN